MASSDSASKRRSLPRGFVVGIAFVYAVGFAALVIMGSGIESVLRSTDDPFGFGVYVAGAGPAIILLSTLFFAIAALRAGLAANRGNLRVSFMRLVGIVVTVWVSTLLADLIVGITVDPRGIRWAGYTIFGYVLAGPGWIIAAAAVVAGLAYLGTLRWQHLNGATRQFAQPEDE